MKVAIGVLSGRRVGLRHREDCSTASLARPFGDICCLVGGVAGMALVDAIYESYFQSHLRGIAGFGICAGWLAGLSARTPRAFLTISRN